MTRWHFSIHALRHHSALAWLQVPSSSTIPSMSDRIARWCGSTSPLRLIATISASVSRSATLAEPRYSTAQREGSSTLRPSALERLGQDRPILTTASLKCIAVSRAVPSALSCSCGCCRISSETLLLIGVTLSQMQSGSGLPQCGQSGTTSSAEPGLELACSDIRPLYASWPVIQLQPRSDQNGAPVSCFDAFSSREPEPTSLENALFRGRRKRGRPGSLPQPVDQEVDHRRGVQRQDLRNEQSTDDGDAERPAQLGAGAGSDDHRNAGKQ